VLPNRMRPPPWLCRATKLLMSAERNPVIRSTNSVPFTDTHNTIARLHVPPPDQIGSQQQNSRLPRHPLSTKNFFSIIRSAYFARFPSIPNCHKDISEAASMPFSLDTTSTGERSIRDPGIFFASSSGPSTLRWTPAARVASRNLRPWLGRLLPTKPSRHSPATHRSLNLIHSHYPITHPSLSFGIFYIAFTSNTTPGLILPEVLTPVIITH
jgi:hypothetical protein